MEIIVSRSKVKRISNQPSTVLIITDQKQENVKHFSYLRSIIINDAKFTSEIKSRSATAKATSNGRKLFSPKKSELNLKKKLVNCYTWSIAL
jgi:hypothetical protein